MPRTARPAFVLLRTLTVIVCAAIVSATAAASALARTEYRGTNVHSLEIWNASDSEMTRELGALQSAGANVVRADLTWSALEPAKGQYSPGYQARLDAFFAGAHARGIKVIATVAATPSWASSNGNWNDAPSNPGDFGDIARYLTGRYGADMAAIEAWNEPNWHQNLLGGDVVGTYTAMLKAFYTGAKQGNPSVDVLAGATAYVDLPFFTGLWAHGGKGYYDGISIHPYADGAAPGNLSVDHSFLGAIQAMHAAQLAAGDHTPLWITEFGWPTGNSGGANSEQQSADYLKQAFGILGGLSYVKGATSYQLRDMGTDTTNPEDNFGLLHKDFTPRPAFAAFTAAMAAGGSNTTGAPASAGTGAPTSNGTGGPASGGSGNPTGGTPSTPAGGPSPAPTSTPSAPTTSPTSAQSPSPTTTPTSPTPSASSSPTPPIVRKGGSKHVPPRAQIALGGRHRHRHHHGR